ncbi:protein of unknown function [Flaviramulus basaltis]|uniref:DUF4249 domain-containing protein n=1 Tax=Flaviramulus basaltis TaxID=369401 RepID=A0A1K2IQE9_9FLAO|nr:DUF4249 domain-containing protein [Flaviramulus basaltis]SFZ94542.1 protein of unknown function [Flaviramulus basaltis]
MKIYFKSLIILFTIIFTSCTDVIDVDVPTSEPRLVIEATIEWEKGTTGNEQLIKLSTSVPYFSSTTNNIVTGASVKITNDADDTEFVFIDQNDGNYINSSFIPVLNEAYTLEVINDGETYIAHETFVPVVDIAEITQTREDGFDSDVLEVNVLFDDPEDEENFYFLKFQKEGDILPELFDISDEFTNGNQMTIFYEREEDEDINQEEFEVGDVVDIEFYGVSEPFYNYIRLLIEQYESVGDPFSTTPVALRGNCTNPSNPDYYAFGYFRLTEVVKANYTFE